jgi:ubiquitin carboxyl-terminal hydrolase L5
MGREFFFRFCFGCGANYHHPLYIQFENSLRRHNHLGLLHALLLGLAKAGKLDAAKEGAKKAMRERKERVAEMRAKGVGAGGMDED